MLLKTTTLAVNNIHSFGHLFLQHEFKTSPVLPLIIHLWIIIQQISHTISAVSGHAAKILTIKYIHVKVHKFPLKQTAGLIDCQTVLII
jgi:hypothetical protein